MGMVAKGGWVQGHSLSKTRVTVEIKMCVERVRPARVVPRAL